MLGNIEDVRDFHRRVMLPRMEEAVGDASLMRFVMMAEYVFYVDFQQAAVTQIVFPGSSSSLSSRS